MSEVGTSLHFWRARAADVRQFVAACGSDCRIVASNSHWTCVVPFDREDEPKLLSAWTGRAIYWSYSEDYGLGTKAGGSLRVCGSNGRTCARNFRTQRTLGCSPEPGSLVERRGE